MTRAELDREMIALGAILVHDSYLVPKENAKKADLLVKKHVRWCEKEGK